MVKSKNVVNDRYECAILIPCYNEEKTIGKVVDDFKTYLPNYPIFVYDNASTDMTAQIAAEHGAKVRYCSIRGKGNVVKQMFKDIEADCYLMVDGDDTYPAADAIQLIRPILRKQADMIIGARRHLEVGMLDRRSVHNMGNRLVNAYLNYRFAKGKTPIKDVMTGYRAMSREFVKGLSVTSRGFEIETEISIYALEHNYRVWSVNVLCRERPKGSFSKIHTIEDGIKILNWIHRHGRSDVDCRENAWS